MNYKCLGVMDTYSQVDSSFYSIQYGWVNYYRFEELDSDTENCVCDFTVSSEFMNAIDDMIEKLYLNNLGEKPKKNIKKLRRK